MKTSQLYKYLAFKPTKGQKDLIHSLYKDGHHLEDISRRVKLDIDSILTVIRKFRLRRKKLYHIYEYQEDKIIRNKRRLEVRQHLVEKFFPSDSENEFFSYGYHIYFKQKQDRQEKQKANCPHKACHIRCAQCGKILADATQYYKELQTNDFT